MRDCEGSERKKLTEKERVMYNLRKKDRGNI